MFGDYRDLAHEFWKIHPYLPTDPIDQTLESNKKLLERAQENDYFELEITGNEYQRRIVRGTVNMALSYLSVGNSEYNGLRKEIQGPIDCLGHLYKHMPAERLQIARALELILDTFEIKKDYDALSGLQGVIGSLIAMRPPITVRPVKYPNPDSIAAANQDRVMEKSKEAYELLKSLYGRIFEIRGLQEQPSRDLKERTASAEKSKANTTGTDIEPKKTVPKSNNRMAR